MLPRLLQEGNAFRDQDWPKAERLFGEAITTEPDRALPYKRLGMTYAAQAKFALSEPPFRRACEIDPKELDVCYYWARTLISLSRFDAALRAYEKDVRPWRGKTLLGMALALDALNRELDAENMYREAVASGDAFEDVTLVSESQRQACRGRGGRT